MNYRALEFIILFTPPAIFPCLYSSFHIPHSSAKMDPSLDLSKLTDADKADLQQQLANEQQKATIQQSKWDE